MRVFVMAKIADSVELAVIDSIDKLDNVTIAEMEYGILCASQRLTLIEMVNTPNGRDRLDGLVIKEDS